MLVEVLLSHQSVPSDRDSVIGSIDDISILEVAGFSKLGQHATDLIINVLTAREFAADFVADGRGISG